MVVGCSNGAFTRFSVFTYHTVVSVFTQFYRHENSCSSSLPAPILGGLQDTLPQSYEPDDKLHQHSLRSIERGIQRKREVDAALPFHSIFHTTLMQDTSIFNVAGEGSRVDPHRVPFRTLHSGARIPAIGLGTFGSDNVSGEQIARATEEAAEVGFRHFDCASVYDNEHLIGGAIKNIIQSGIPRDQLWINSKLWNDRHGEDDVVAACQKSLDDLGLDYLDLYFVHWPFPNFHAKGVDVSSRDPHARPYIHEEFMKTWRQMERLVDEGLVRHIGTSNMTRAKLELLLRDCRIGPACNEMELHPHFQQSEFFEWVRSQNIMPIGYSPIGSPARPQRDRTEEDTAPIEDPLIVQIAQKHGVHPATLCVKWGQQRGQIPIPFSTNPKNILANLQAVVSPPLSDDEMRRIADVDRNCRLIKGQVFLWRDGQDWRDLWDEDGTIAP